MKKRDLVDVVEAALRALGGAGSVLDVSRIIWEKHGEELKTSGNLFYTWQYDIRWAAQELRRKGVLQPVSMSANRQWVLAK